MAYATGSAATVDDILEAIENFAIGRGWTIAKRATNLLFLEKGICKVTLARTSYTYTDYQTGVAVPGLTDYTIGAALCTTINTALNTFHSHTGSLSTSDTDADSVHCNNLFNGVLEYHLFSGDTGAGDPDYIHCVFRTSASNWRHLSFGLVDKGDLTHSGVAFLVGNAGYFYAHTTGPVNNNLYFNAPQNAPYPFAERSVTVRGTANNIYAPDAMPNTANWPVMSSNALLETTAIEGRPNLVWPSSHNSADGNFCDPIMGSPQSSWGGNVMLMTPPVIFNSSGDQRFCYLGDYPNVRLLNMEGIAPGAEITLGAETWFVCPIGRQWPWGTQAEVGYNYSTGHYGLAYKKIV